MSNAATDTTQNLFTRRGEFLDTSCAELRRLKGLLTLNQLEDVAVEASQYMGECQLVDFHCMLVKARNQN